MATRYCPMPSMALKRSSGLMWSCETQLLVTAHDIVKNLAQGDQVDLASLDFSKAFNRVLHRQLLQKLHCYGVRNNTELDPGIPHQQKSAGGPRRCTLVPGSSPVWCTPRYSFGTSSVCGLHQRSSWCSQVLQRQTVHRWQPPLQENLQPGTAATGPTVLGGLGEHLADELQHHQI